MSEGAECLCMTLGSEGPLGCLRVMVLERQPDEGLEAA